MKRFMMKIKRSTIEKVKKGVEPFIVIIFYFFFTIFIFVFYIRNCLKKLFGIKNIEVEIKDPENINQLIKVLSQQYHKKYKLEDEADIQEYLIAEIKKYIEAGADINAQNDEGNTPLIEIFKSDIYDIFEDYDGDKEEIIKNRADIDFPQVKNLIRLGADKSIANHKGETIESIALKHGKEIYSLYQEHFL